MASVFDLQKRSRRLSWLLLLLFGLAVMLVAYAYGYLVGLFFPPAKPYVFAAGMGIPLVIATYHYFQLRQGGSAIARAFGGRRIWHSGRLGQSSATHVQPLQPSEQTLLNVVDEIAIAAHMHPPRVYVLDGQWGINAFVCGHDDNDLTLVVTEGLLTHLNRDEIAGVIAHEYSHLKYGDNVLNMQLLALCKGLNWINDLVDLLPMLNIPLKSDLIKLSDQQQNAVASNLLLLVGVRSIIFIIYVIGCLGSACCSLIKSAILRQREYLADAAGSQFVRSDGLINALYKIAEHSAHGYINHPRSSDFSHFAFTVTSVFGLNTSHPPINKRILRLKPNFERSAQLLALLGKAPADGNGVLRSNSPTPALIPLEYTPTSVTFPTSANPVSLAGGPVATGQAQPLALTLSALWALLNLAQCTHTQRLGMLLYLLHSYNHSPANNPIKPATDIAAIAAVTASQRIMVVLKLVQIISAQPFTASDYSLWQDQFTRLLVTTQPVRFVMLVLLAYISKRLSGEGKADNTEPLQPALLYHWAYWLVSLNTTPSNAATAATSKKNATVARMLKPFALGVQQLPTTPEPLTATSLLACITHFKQLAPALRNEVYWLTDQALFVDLLLAQDERDGLLVLKQLLHLD